ncbi:MAG: YicC family protein [Tissierellia bacterium]|nr:YicC family protein [Tissierellia bacterium]
MIRSMTGYGKGEYENELYRFTVEIKSVNHRYGDVLVKLPRHISYLEDTIKKRVKESLKRGKIDIYINLEYIKESAIDVKVDIPLALSYKEALEDLVKNLKLEEEIKLDDILTMDEIVRTERRELDEDLLEECLMNALDMAIENILQMRLKEGQELKEDLLLKLDLIQDMLELVDERAPLVVEEYRDKLRERISELLDDSLEIDEDRLSIEVAIFADKCSIDEEIVRLRSHIKQFKSILEEDNPVGRKLDFLVQEFNREINTIGSKANDMEISKYVVDLKAEVEKIREQIQNIE